MRSLPIAAIVCLLLISSVVESSHACTAFVLETEDGPFFGANMDLYFGDGLAFVNRRGLAKEGSLPSTTGEVVKWTSKYGSISFNLLGNGFVWGGMNEAGLAVSTMALRCSVLPEADERPAMSSPFWVQYVLDTCASVEEAVGVDSLVRIQDATPNHFLLADESGDCATIEYLDGRYVVHRGETLPVKAMANGRYADAIVYIEKGIVPSFNPGASVQRVAGAALMAEDYRKYPISSPVDYSFEVLTEVVVDPKEWWGPLFKDPYSQWHVVFDIARREVHFRTEAIPEIRHVSLDAFDLACDGPLIMLDINAELAGNVENDFTPYDHEMNLKVFYEFCKRWGIKMTMEDAEEGVRAIQGFACAK